MIQKIFVIIILILGLFFRLWQINSLPPSLNWDEVSLGYNAYSLAHTGRDEWGINFPLIFRAYGDYKLPLYIYLSVPFITVLGLTPLSIKLVSILAGTLSCFLFYLICQKIFNRTSISLLGLVIFTFSPWSIFLSRIALEANLFLCLFLASFYYLVSRNYSLSSFFFGLCLFAYNSSRVLLFPYLLILIYLVIKQKINFKRHWYRFSFLALAILLFIFQSLSNSGQARYKWVSLLDTGAINRINELRAIYPRFVVNKYTYFAYQASLNYLKHFDPRYVFVNGSSNYQFNIPHFPLISPLLFPFLVIGLFLLIRQIFVSRRLEYFLIAFFLLISPLPSAITRDAPQILRSLTFLPLITLTILIGISHFRYRRVSLIYTLIALTLTLISFTKTYPIYARTYSRSWQYGYSQMVDYLKSNYSQYDQIVITKKYGEPHEFVLFYTQYDPAKYQSTKIWDYHADWYWINGFDKYQFVNDWDIPQTVLPRSTLLFTSPGNYNQTNSHLQTTIYFLDGSPAFDIVSYD